MLQIFKIQRGILGSLSFDERADFWLFCLLKGRSYDLNAEGSVNPYGIDTLDYIEKFKTTFGYWKPQGCFIKMHPSLGCTFV